MIQTNKKGQREADNIIDPLLGFNSDSTWTVTGTGSASVSVNQYFSGSGSLYIENTDPTNDLTASNAVQSTVIPKDGSYWFSTELFKTLADTEITGEIEVFKGLVSFDVQEFSIGSTTTEDDKNNQWVRYVANQPYDFTKGDIITFTIKIDGILGFVNPSTFLYWDGVKLESNDRGNYYPSGYSNPIHEVYRVKESSTSPSVGDDESVTWMADSSGTLDGTVYEKGDYLITSNSGGVQKTTIIVDFSAV